MKIEYQETNVISNVPTENTRKMGISEDGLEHIMSLLTNLYKDPELAVIREYYTNAVDAHKVVEQTKEIEVTLPTWDLPHYTVKDYGCGMSAVDILDIYSQYGASTKRHTDDLIGAYGLGCKSALAITQQFTLMSVKDGTKTTALISKTNSGVNDVNVVNTVETDEPNGTTVKIPVEDYYSFNTKAREFFQFVETERLLVDGSRPESAFDDATLITDEKDPTLIAYVRMADPNDYYYSSNYGSTYIVMGNVPYELSRTELYDSYKRRGISPNEKIISMGKYFPVVIGSVDLTPSREGLRFTDKTNETIDSLMTLVEDNLYQTALLEVEELENVSGIYEVQAKWKGYFDTPLMWDGEVVPKKITSGTDTRTIRRYGTTSNHDTYEVINLEGKQGLTFIVTGLNADEYTKINSLLTSFLESRDLNKAGFVVTSDEEIHNNKWINLSDKFEVIAYTDIQDEARTYRKELRKLNGGSAPKKAISYYVLDIDDMSVSVVPYKEIDEDIAYLRSRSIDKESVRNYIQGLYTNSSGWSSVSASSLASHLSRFTDRKKVLLLGGGRTVSALQKRIEGAVDILDEVTTYVKKFQEDFPEYALDYLAIQEGNWIRGAKSLGLQHRVDEIYDPKVSAVLAPDEEMTDVCEKLEKLQRAINYFQFSSPDIPVKVVTYPVRGKIDREFCDKYSLIQHFIYANVDDKAVDDIILYLNTVHVLSEPEESTDSSE